MSIIYFIYLCLIIIVRPLYLMNVYLFTSHIITFLTVCLYLMQNPSTSYTYTSTGRNTLPTVGLLTRLQEALVIFR